VSRVAVSATQTRIAEELRGRPFIGDHEAAQSDYVPRRPNGTRYQVREFPINRALAAESVHGEEMIIHNPVRGEDLNILVSAAPVRRDAQIVAAVSVFQDISTLRAFERQ